MTTVSAGATGTATLAATSTINITLDPTEKAYVTVARGAVTLFGGSIASSCTIGPYLTGDVFTITAQRGAVDYTVSPYSAGGTTSVTVSGITDATAAGQAMLLAATAAAQSALIPHPVVFQVACSDRSTSLTTGTDVASFRAPFAFTLTDVRSMVDTVSSSGLVTVDINEAGTSVLGASKLSIDANEKTSTTAATPTSISDTAIADDAELTFDIDAAGTGAKGLLVTLIGTKP
jgi:hypothetical protein